MLTRWWKGVRSLWLSLRSSASASRQFGRALKLERAGRKEDALALARQALSMLRGGSGHHYPGVVKPALQSTQVMLTVQAERLAQELNCEGAMPSDMVDAIAYLRELPDGPESGAARVKRACLPYLEARLRLASHGGAS